MGKRYKSDTMEALHGTMQSLKSVGAIDAKRLAEFDEACLLPLYHVYKDRRGEWRWRLVSGGGKIIASSGEGYESRKACVAAMTILKFAAEAEIAA